MNVSPVRFRKRLDRSFHTIYEELALVLVRLFAGNLQGVCQPSQENIIPTDTLGGGGDINCDRGYCYMLHGLLNSSETSG